MQNKTAIALGTFDGVHLGHRAVLNLPKEFKKVAVTFKKPPKMELSRTSGLITTSEEKCRRLRDIGIDEICQLEFKAVRDMSAKDFLSYLNEKYSPCLISCGYNYRFGKNGEGDTDVLANFCRLNGIDFKCCESVCHNGTPVSSTIIREMLSSGEIEKANILLSEPFSFTAQVISGDKRGRTMGFPTINQKYPQELVKIKFGVYETLVECEGKEYSGITNIGVRPTFETDFVISETHILDFTGDLYGNEVKITPQRFLREEKKFSTLEELRSQIDADLKYIKEIKNG